MRLQPPLLGINVLEVKNVGNYAFRQFRIRAFSLSYLSRGNPTDPLHDMSRNPTIHAAIPHESTWQNTPLTDATTALSS